MSLDIRTLLDIFLALLCVLVAIGIYLEARDAWWRR